MVAYKLSEAAKDDLCDLSIFMVGKGRCCSIGALLAKRRRS
jgi:hypothetical protein